MRINFFYSTGTTDKRVPEVDIAFAINANAADAETNFRQMKSVIASIIDKYGMGKMRYALTVYGTNPNVKINFNEDFPTDDAIKRYFIFISFICAFSVQLQCRVA